MAITKLSDSSITTGDKYISMLAGNLPTGNYDSIATVTVGAGGSATVSFTSIPSTYTHLQIRGIARDARSAIGDSLTLTYNSDTGSNYMQYHNIYADGSTVSAAAGNTSHTSMLLDRIAGNTATASSFGAIVIDILDYANTNKYKTLRALAGADNNGSGAVAFGSALWMSTTAISSITLSGANGNFNQYTQFALYGIKGS